MYIQSYQIHNVLNVYRKQLSQGPGAKAQRQTPGAQNGDRVELSNEGQRQSIIDKVSAEIVNNISQKGPQKSFDEALVQYMDNRPGDDTIQALRKDTKFTYTTIDENNDKITNTLPVKNFSPIIGGVENNTQKAVE